MFDVVGDMFDVEDDVFLSNTVNHQFVADAIADIFYCYVVIMCLCLM